MTSLRVRPPSGTDITGIETLQKTAFSRGMTARNPIRTCQKCGEDHLPPLIDDLCMRGAKSSGDGPARGDDGEMSTTEQLQGMVASLAQSVQAVSSRVGSLESSIKDYFERKKDKKQKRKKRKKKGKRKADLTSSSSPSPSSSSSESSSEGDVASEASVSSFSSGASAGDRGRSKLKKSKSKEKKHRSSAASLLRKSRFTHKPFIERGKPVNCFERLMVCSLRMMKDIMMSGTNTEGVLTHLIVLAEKAATGYYRINSVIAYDRATRMAAAEHGIGKFSLIDNSLVLQYLCYDASVNASASAGKGTEKSKRSSKAVGLCYRFNKSTGCERERCRYLHVCSNCGDGAHGLFGCKKPKAHGAGGGAGAPSN